MLGIGVTGELPGCSQGTLVSIVHRTCVAVVLLVKEQALADDLHARITLPDGFKQPQTWSEALALSNNSFQTVFGCDHGNTSSPGMRVEEAPTAQQTMDSTSAVVVADDMLPLLCQTIVDPHVQKQSGIAVGPCHSELLEALLDGGVSGESLAAFLRRTTLQATTTCSTLNRNFTSSHANCSVDALHHIVRFASGSVMVSVNVEHVSPDEGTDPEVIMTWTACTSCKCRTEAQALTSIAAQYPLYNFLALLIHDPSFVPTSIPFCKLHEEKFVDPEASTASGIAKILGIRGSDTSQLIAHLNATGINAGHRFDIVRCFQIGDKMVSFHVEQVHPMSIGELPHELNVDMNRRMADHGAQLQAQTLVIQRYWARLIAHMDALSKHIAQHASGQSKTFKSFRATIEQEHVRFNEMINLAALEVERLSKSGRRQSGAQVSYDFGSPTLLLRTLRKSVFDKVSKGDRDVNDTMLVNSIFSSRWSRSTESCFTGRRPIYPRL